ncbi:MAG: PsbP-related protein [Candidatus Curtissbacteria bacterium]
MPAKKGFAQPLALLILLVVLGVIVFNRNSFQGWLSTLQSPKADIERVLPEWKSYENKTYNFSVKYPNEWFVRQFGDYAANFQVTDPERGEATAGAIQVKLSVLKEKVDQNEFEKIYNLGAGKEILEPLDVRSTITKIKNMEIDTKRGVEYVINRHFSALEGPKGQYTHVFAVAKDGVVLKFFSSADTKEEQKFGSTLQKMIDSLKF